MRYHYNIRPINSYYLYASNCHQYLVCDVFIFYLNCRLTYLQISYEIMYFSNDAINVFSLHIIKNSIVVYKQRLESNITVVSFFKDYYMNIYFYFTLFNYWCTFDVHVKENLYVNIFIKVIPTIQHQIDTNKQCNF